MSESLLNIAKTHVLDFLPEAHAIAGFAFPTTRQEAWKYTRIGAITNNEWHVAPSSEVKAAANTIEVVNGYFEVGNLPAGVRMEQAGNLSKPMQEKMVKMIQAAGTKDIFDAAFQHACTDALVIHISKGTVIEETIHLNFTITENEGLATPALFVFAESHTQVDFTCEWKAGIGRTLHLPQFFFELESEARVRFYQLQNSGSDEVILLREHVQQGPHSFFGISTITANAAWVRNELTIVVDGEGCESDLSGAYFPRGTQLVDNHTCVDHRVPHCNSNELYKGVMFERGKGVFNGKVFVRPDAQKTNAFQTNANIMMSDDATVNTKPELEIYADDVKCSHGSTTGQFDEEALFYLRARGLGEESAKMLLVSAFTSDVLERIHNESWHDHVREVLMGYELITE
jgi:Fe-S cluster assembly protein SufD